nr:hypothetical protein [Aquabacterium sp.]
MIRRLLLGLLAAVLLLAAVVAGRTLWLPSRQLQVAAIQPLAVDEAAVAASLAVAIRARTVSSLDDAQANADQFAALQAHLQARYPRVH